MPCFMSINQVLAVLTSFDESKPSGPHELPARILKETAHDIAPSLCELFNKSLGSLPTDRKLPNKVPVRKKGNKEYENCRPISPLYFISKIMERFLFNATERIKYIGWSAAANPVSVMARRSCVTQLVEVIDFIGH